MSLQRKVILILITLFVGLFLVLNYFVNTVLIERFVFLEQMKIKQDFERIRNAYEADLHNSQTLVKDWGQWTDTYQFMGGEGDRKEYIANNLMNSSFALTKMNLIAYADTAGRIVYGKALDLESGKEIPLPRELKGLAESGAILAPGERSGRKGIITLSGRPAFFYSWSIVTSEGKGPMRGTIIMARFITESEIATLSGVTKLRLERVAANDRRLPEAIKKEASVVSNEFATSIVRDGGKNISGYMMFRDIRGNPAFVLKFVQPRDIYHQGLESLFYFKLYTLGAAIIFLSLIIGVMQRQVVDRVAWLSRAFKQIAASADFSARVPVKGADELAALSADINKTLGILEEAHVALRKSEERFEQTCEQSREIVWEVDAEGVFTYVSKTVEMVTGYSPEELVGKKRFYDFFPEEGREEFMKTALEMFAGKATVRDFLSKGLTKDGRIVVLSTNGAPILDENGNLKGYRGSNSDVTEKIRADEARRESEEKYRALFDASSDSIVVFDMEGRIIDCNRAALVSGGYERDELVGKLFSELDVMVDPDTMKKLAGYYADLQKGRSSFSFENRGRRKNGEVRWFDTHISLLREGAIAGQFQCISRDIIERKRAEEILRESEERYQAFFDAASDMVFLKDENFRYLLLNKANAEFFGRPASELAGKDDFELMPREMAESCRMSDMNALEANGIVTTNEQVGDRVYETRKFPVRLKEGKTGVGAFIRDITESKRTEEALRESEEKMRTITGSARDAIVMIDENGNVSFWNPAAADIFGYSAQEVVGKELHTILAPARFHDSYREGFEQFKLTGEGAAVGKTLELVAVRKNGVEFPIELSLSAIRLRNGWGAVGIVRDITERKREAEEKENLHRQLVQSQKMESIGTLAGGVAHDFNNMLAVILGNAQLAGMDLPPDSPVRGAIDEIENAALRAKELTMKLLTFARKEKLNVRNMAVNAMLADLAAFLQRSVPKKIEIKTALTSNPPVVSMDANQMYQVFLNICTNACDAMPDGGTLTIESSKVSIDEEYAKQHNEAVPGEYCLVQISDTGVGMISEVRKRIFDPFFTTKGAGKGTGLGLSVSYGIVKNHGGFIGVYSEPGRGAGFKVYLPVAVGDAAAAAAEPEKHGESLRKGAETILVVDDEEAVLSLAGRILEKAGYIAILADKGKEAVRVYRERHDEIALVVLDMVMPEMDGRDVFNALKEIDPDVKVILSSGFSVSGQAGALMEEGIQAFVQKPFSIADLCNTVRRVIDDATA